MLYVDWDSETVIFFFLINILDQFDVVDASEFYLNVESAI